MSSRPAQMVNESRFGDCVLTIEVINAPENTAA
jgi:hypothetical protein